MESVSQSFEAPKPGEGQERWDIGRALVEISAVQARVSPTGSITAEMGDLAQIVAAVRGGQMTPLEGVTRAYKIEREDRQDYH